MTKRSNVLKKRKCYDYIFTMRKNKKRKEHYNQHNRIIGDEDRATRRVSYLKATWGERMHVDSDLELSDSEPVHIHRR